MKTNSIYDSIAHRTGGSVYIGVVGAVRTGKSTFIKKFMETLVIPNITDEYMRERAKDELPQSGSGRMIMTSEPKFVPEDAVTITMDDGAVFAVRLIDSVGYMIRGATGGSEDGGERKVTTPWFDYEVSMSAAAEVGTKKVISEHSTIGIVVTTDGTVTDFDREDYIESEERVIKELTAIGKPYVILLNTLDPKSEKAQTLSRALSEKYGVSCIAENCMTMTESDITAVIRTVLYEFPAGETEFYLPDWVEALPVSHPIRQDIHKAALSNASCLHRIHDVRAYLDTLIGGENVSDAAVREIDLSSGTIAVNLDVPRHKFYETLSADSALDIKGDGDLISIIADLAETKRKYDKIASALEDVKNTGYGIVLPTRDELTLQEPEIVRHGGRYSVRLKASAPSIHMMLANVETEVSPAVGGEKSSGDIINYLLQEFEGDTGRIWESNIFGKSLYEIAGEGLNAKIKYLPEDARKKLRETLERIINEGSSGLICIIL